MHVVLGISELQRDIFRQLILEDAQGTIANLAQTCRAFEENALSLLWEYQRGLLPLIKCASGILTENLGQHMGTGLTRVIVRSPSASYMPLH